MTTAATRDMGYLSKVSDDKETLSIAKCSCSVKKAVQRVTN
jgi:hypothetical protein